MPLIQASARIFFAPLCCRIWRFGCSMTKKPGRGQKNVIRKLLVKLEEKSSLSPEPQVKMVEPAASVLIKQVRKRPSRREVKIA
jgi:hypothetical protein